jgi:hypothetical protein
LDLSRRRWTRTGRVPFAACRNLGPSQPGSVPPSFAARVERATRAGSKFSKNILLRSCGKLVEKMWKYIHRARMRPVDAGVKVLHMDAKRRSIRRP